MAALSQENRYFHFDSPLGPDKLLISEFQWEEKISGLFKGNLVLVSEDFDIDPADILQRNVSAGVQRIDGSFRWFNGHVSVFRQIHRPGRLAYYEAEIVPWLWFLTLTSDCYIHQDLTVPKIIEWIFQAYDFADFDMSKLTGSHEEWKYCCQYRETAFEFVSRLMESEGIYYFFQHERGKHTMQMLDKYTLHPPCSSNARFRFEKSLGPGYSRNEETVMSWNSTRKTVSASLMYRDFDDDHPDDMMEVAFPTTQEPPLSPKFKTYDYPGEYEEHQEGTDWIQMRAEEEDSDHDTAAGTSCCPTMSAGYRFDFTGYLREDQNKNWMITSVTHRGKEGSFYAGTDAQEGTYENSFTAMPSDRQYRPPLDTPKAIMRGAQTAKVVGPPGEEIYTNKRGEVKVRFHWDRDTTSKTDANCTCWIRTMQPLAGPGFGHIWLPRIGQEVIVDFLEGDPDRPIITGVVYNADNLPPVDLEKDASRSGIKTRSTKGGESENANELWFEDKRGQEQIILHAERDLDITVEHDTHEIVDHDRELIVKGNQTEIVKGDKHGTVRGEHREVIQSTLSQQIGANVQITAGANYAIEAGGELHLKAGGRIVFEAGAGVTFIGNATSFVDVTSAGVMIQGPVTLINSGLPMPMSGLGSFPGLAGLPGGLPGVSPFSAVSGALGGIGGGFNGLSGNMLGAALNASGLSAALGAVTALMSGGVGGVLSSLGSQVTGALGAMGGSFGLGAAALGSLGGALGSLSQTLGAILPGGLIGGIESLTTPLTSAAAGLSGAGGLLGPAGSAVSQMLAGGPDAALGASQASSLFSQISQQVLGPSLALSNAGSNLMNLASSAVPGDLGALPSHLSGIGGGISQFAGNLENVSNSFAQLSSVHSLVADQLSQPNADPSAVLGAATPQMAQAMQGISTGLMGASAGANQSASSAYGAMGPAAALSPAGPTA